MALYSVCSYIIDSEEMPRQYMPFLIKKKTNPAKVDLTIRYTSDPLNTREIIEITSFQNMTVLKEKIQYNNYRWIYKLNNNCGTIVVNADYSKVTIHYLKGIEYITCGNLGELFAPFLQIILECKMINDGFIILHSACVEKDGNAYAFTGPSGIGKSTRAQRWCELLQATMISGDRPAIKVEDKTVYGVPWDGKERIYRNVHYPLAIILIVKRSDSINVEKVSKNNKLQFLSSQISIPIWDSAVAANAILSLRKLIDIIPVYELYCGIDNESILRSYDLISKL